MAIAKLLVANRGEIAVRIFRTCRARGIATVAVVPPDDVRSLHVRNADEVVEITSYLHAEEHIRAARQAGADAIHPGYGFLAENADFAEGVDAAGLTWVGPPAEALRQGGDKLQAKRIAERAGVPVAPTGDADEIGYPLIVKAAAGGGGRGMRVVREPRELEAALEAAGREAKAAFGDDRVFCERYLERPRHVEVQILAGADGSVTHLFERDCSIQRRHQKVLEESPAPRLDADLRGRIIEAAMSFARAVGYRNAGTAEFMVAGDDFYFLELNGRIQVEHPVTEEVTGADLVDWQLRVAEGGSVDSYRPSSEGHAIEVRLYAEDPVTFLPQAGRIEHLRLPTGIRVDAGVEAGDEVGTAYDPMIAKLIAWGQDRSEALAKLRQALGETEVVGVTTNLPFLRWLVSQPDVRAARATTAFLVEHPPLSRPPVRPAPAPWQLPWRLNRPAPPPHAPPALGAGGGVSRAGESSSLTAPMPGTVIRVLVGEGEEVRERQPLLVLEAMKMETPLVSPYNAVVRRLHVAEGDRVAGGALLVELEE